jgi:SAM-dependent methyltransferase
MASFNAQTKSTYATTNWDHYRQGRPPYPPSLTDIIYGYRRRHPNAAWERLVDIGAGSGVASTNFLPDFNTIHVSDPSAANIEQARSFLPAYAARLGLAPTLEYSVATGEEVDVHVGEGNADLAICATAAHFIDPDGLAAAIGKMLRPGGTLAVFSYWMPTFPGKSAAFHDVFERVWDALVLGSLIKAQGSVDDLSTTRLGSVVARRMAGKGVLDSLPLPEELFTDPQRVYINAGSGEIAYSQIFRKFEPADRKPGGISRVSASDKIVHYETGKDAEAEGWLFEVDKKWLSVFVNTIRPDKNKLSEDETKEAYAEWDRIFDEECEGGVLNVLWPAYLALATKK